MIHPAIFVIVLLVFVAEALILWFDQIMRARAEQAYWAAKRNAPDLYDWSQEPDL